MTEECGEIVFWTLRKKFVASSDEMPEHSSQVMYYSLAIGHHVGVIDCLNVAFRCPLTEYEDWLALVETGFISNNSEERLLASDDYQQQLAEAIYKGLRNYFLAHPMQSAPQGATAQTASTVTTPDRTLPN